MVSNDNDTNIVSFKIAEQRRDQPHPPKELKQKQVVATVSLRDRDVSLTFPQADLTIVLKPRAAFELAILILTAIRAAAEKYGTKEPEDD